MTDNIIERLRAQAKSTLFESNMLKDMLEADGVRTNEQQTWFKLKQAADLLTEAADRINADRNTIDTKNREAAALRKKISDDGWALDAARQDAYERRIGDTW